MKEGYGKDLTLTGGVDQIDFGFNAHHVMIDARSTNTDIKCGFNSVGIATLRKGAVGTWDFNTDEEGARYFYIKGTNGDIVSIWAW